MKLTTTCKRVIVVIMVFSCQLIVAFPSQSETFSIDIGVEGASAMHGDTYSSDTTPLPGPGMYGINSKINFFMAACSTILIRSDGRPMVLGTSFIGRNPEVRILEEQKGSKLAKLSLPAGSLLGGVYAYLDNSDRLVMVDGSQNLIRVKAEKKKKILFKRWDIWIDSSVSLASAVNDHCGGMGCDAVVSISPGANGDVWFATKHSVVGIYNGNTGYISTIKLAEGERIDNSFSTTNDGRAAVATNKALYLLKKNAEGEPAIKWKYAYDAGSARKPGQLSHGTGATPSFFGPVTGTEYVTITDNADDLISLLVFDASPDGADTVKVICSKTLFAQGSSGTENSAIGINNSVIVASTYGYPYPAVPDGAGPAVPEKAIFEGGMVRVDIDKEACDCGIIWENQVSSSAVPKLSTADDLIYTVERKRVLPKPGTGIADSYYFTVIDPETGDVLRQDKIGMGTLADTLQMAGNIGPNGVYWQGTIGGVTRVSPK